MREEKGGKLREILGAGLNVASYVLLGLALLLCAYAMLQTRTNGYVNIGGYSFFRVITGSMEPTIPTGALLISRETGIEEIRVGDIICYRSDSGDTRGLIITHRVVAVLQGPDGVELETRGDANTVADGGTIMESELIGRVVAFTGAGSAASGLMSLLTSGGGFVLLILFPLLMLSSLLLSRSVKTIREEMSFILREEQRREAEKRRREQQQAAGISPEELEEMRRRIMSELLAQKDEMMSVLREQLRQERLQGESYDSLEQKTGGSGTTE